MKSKIFAEYLPQFHETEENNEFWGVGFTDWVGVKKSKVLFDGHCQPRIPLNSIYYDLSDYRVIKRQADMAKKYGVNGFSIYHYWFENGKKVLEKPIELLLEHREIDIEFFLSWDNTSWVRSWSNIAGNDWTTLFDNDNKFGKKILLKFEYGEKKDWKEHFDYLLPFFMDSRYYKIDNKPVFAFMKRDDADVQGEMLDAWNRWAIDCGFSGMWIMTGESTFRSHNKFDSEFVFQPRFSGWAKKDAIVSRVNRYLKCDLSKNRNVKYLMEYSEIWNKVYNHAKKNARKELIYCGFVRYDDSPRRGHSAAIVYNESPELFRQYFSKLYRLSCETNRPFILLNAWNEWGEGAYLEPDEQSGYEYLEALKRAIEEVK